ncbi:MAG: site-specific DNA-methyltransferase [Prevotella sp.]|nr:site-specific DNA-methyltransferase [Prevotella sp.]
MSVISETKQSLLSELQARVEDKILEPSNAALLSKLITNAESDDEALAIAALGTTYKRTGFHFDKRMEEPRMSDTIKYFKKNEALSFGEAAEGEPIHKLIIGENYDALQNLLIQYRNSIDVIYIDPPYGKDSMGEFAKTNYKNAISRDNLLSMLYFRLQLAKQLLSERGVIFCSIDDKNQAYVKCLFDEVFREKNYITTIPKKGSGGRQDSKHFAIVHEYLLCYAKSIDNYESGKILVNKEYRYYDEEKNLNYNEQLLRKWGDNSRREDRPNLFYPIYFNPNDNSLSVKRENDEDVEIYPMLDANNEGCWRWGKTTMGEAFKEGLVVVKVKRSEYIPYEKVYEEPDVSSSKLYTSWIDDIDTSTGKTLFKTIIPPEQFKYPKAVDYIERIINMSTANKDAVILDFFAGSGTTGHAILDLNNIDGGHRTFIICQQNEITETTPNGIAYDVTSKRLKRIMTGECYDGSKDFKWIEDNEPYGGKLEVYEIAEVSNASASPGQTPFDVIDETLYGIDKFKTAREKIEWVCNNFSQTQMTVNKED